jgi:hypothetical protein
MAVTVEWNIQGIVLWMESKGEDLWGKGSANLVNWTVIVGSNGAFIRLMDEGFTYQFIIISNGNNVNTRQNRVILHQRAEALGSK